MSPGLRLAFYFAVGIHFAVMCLFAWIWVVTGMDAAALWIGMHGFLGALSTRALWADRQKQKGIRA